MGVVVDLWLLAGHLSVCLNERWLYDRGRMEAQMSTHDEQIMTLRYTLIHYHTEVDIHSISHTHTHTHTCK